MHTRVLSQGKSGQGMMLITHLHPAARLRMSGAIPLLPQYGFMMWTGNFNFTFPSNGVHDLVCLPRNGKAITKHAVTCTYTAYCCIWLKHTVTWIHATWCSNTPVPMSLDCNKKSCDMKQDMSTTKSTEQIWSQLHSLTFHFHCCRQLCLFKCISSHNFVGSSIPWTYAQDINGHITKITVCLDPVVTLDSSTIDVPFNLDGEENVLPVTDFSTVTRVLTLTCLEYDRGMTAVFWNDSCVTQWQLCYIMTAVTQWQLCYIMTALLHNGSCVTQ